MRTRRKAKAYHEAGHAVVARVLGVSVAYATRLAADAEGTPGRSTRCAPGIDHRRQQLLFLRFATGNHDCFGGEIELMARAGLIEKQFEHLKQTAQIRSIGFDGDFSFRPAGLRTLRQRYYKSTLF